MGERLPSTYAAWLKILFHSGLHRRHGTATALRGQLEDPTAFLYYDDSGFVAAPEDQDVVGRWSPICEGTNLLFDEDRLMLIELTLPAPSRP